MAVGCGGLPETAEQLNYEASALWSAIPAWYHSFRWRSAPRPAAPGPAIPPAADDVLVPAQSSSGSDDQPHRGETPGWQRRGEQGQPGQLLGASPRPLEMLLTGLPLASLVSLQHVFEFGGLDHLDPAIRSMRWIGLLWLVTRGRTGGIRRRLRREYFGLRRFMHLS